ncbi:signal recognition particle-docking protein FtsY [Candidatus Sumerlaeota bacterium]|nr:signal recognition particle-docking protein FtsY [Candidatus Sumerlaeota bacterium]
MTEPKEERKGLLSRLFGGKTKEEKEPQGESPATPPEEQAPPEIASEAAPKAEPEPETAPQPAETKAGLFARLKGRLAKTKTGLVGRVLQAISLHGKVDEELLEEIESILVQADVGIETTTKIIDRMRQDAEARRADDASDLVDVFKKSILDIVGQRQAALALRPDSPTVILVVGVNGVGKTTTIGKIARQYRDQGKKVMLVAGDTFRAAAVEQLAIWAERTGSHIVKQEMGADPGAVCYDALASADARDYDAILIDTAGRLHTKSNLMEELKKIDRVVKKVIPDAPHETLLILDATTGQNAISQAKFFGEAVRVTGLVMTKLDGTAKGGILIALCDLFDVPVVKIGIGESADDLRDFDPEAFVEALFAE